MNYKPQITQDIIDIQKSTLQIIEIRKEIEALPEKEEKNER